QGGIAGSRRYRDRGIVGAPARMVSSGQGECFARLPREVPEVSRARQTERMMRSQKRGTEVVANRLSLHEGKKRERVNRGRSSDQSRLYPENFVMEKAYYQKSRLRR